MMYAEHLRVLIKASCRCIKQQTQSDLHVCNTHQKQRTATVYATNGALQKRVHPSTVLECQFTQTSRAAFAAGPMTPCLRCAHDRHLLQICCCAKPAGLK